MIGTIQVVRRSKSNQNLSVQVDGAWYVSKNWEWETDPQIVGKRIVFEPRPWTPPGSNTEIIFIDNYVFEAASTGPAAAAMDAAMDAGTANVPPTPPVVAYSEPYSDPSGSGYVQSNAPQAAPQAPNKEAMIVAQALCKCCTRGPADQVFSNFVFLYNKFNSWDHTTPF